MKKNARKRNEVTKKNHERNTKIKSVKQQESKKNLTQNEKKKPY